MSTKQSNISSANKPVLLVIKVGGNIIDDEAKLNAFVQQFASVKDKGHLVLVHGGGKVATQLALQLGIKQELMDGRRITDSETLKVVTMVYAGLVNKNIVAQLQQQKMNAIGLCGADGNLLRAHKRGSDSQSIGTSEIDYGYVGDVDSVNASLLSNLLNTGFVPVVAPITHDGNGQLLNTNADTIAQEIATALSDNYSVTLVYTFEKPGVLTDPGNNATLIRQITEHKFSELVEQKIVSAGMIPKLQNALEALHKGVSKVLIGRAEELHQLIRGETGTAIVIE